MKRKLSFRRMYIRTMLAMAGMGGHFYVRNGKGAFE